MIGERYKPSLENELESALRQARALPELVSDYL